jgi:hypothetical protein
LELLAFVPERLESLDLAFFVIRVLAAPGTELAQFELVLLLATIFGRRVIALLTNGALEGDDAAVTFGHGTTLLTERGEGSKLDALPSNLLKH